VQLTGADFLAQILQRRLAASVVQCSVAALAVPLIEADSNASLPTDY
jgi:hypothetical protein